VAVVMGLIGAAQAVPVAFIGLILLLALRRCVRGRRANAGVGIRMGVGAAGRHGSLSQWMRGMRGDCLSRVPNERPKLLLNPLPLTARNFASSREPDA